MMKSFLLPSPRTHKPSLQPLIDSEHLTPQQAQKLDFLERGNLESPIVQYCINNDILTVARAKKLNPSQRLSLEDGLVQALIEQRIITVEKALTLTLTQRVSLEGGLPEHPTLRQQIQNFQKNIERATDTFLKATSGYVLSTMKTTEQKVDEIFSAMHAPLLEQYWQGFASCHLYDAKEEDEKNVAFAALIDTTKEIILNTFIACQESLLNTAELAKGKLNDAYCDEGYPTSEFTHQKSTSWQSTSWQFPLFTSRQNSREEALKQPLLTVTNPLQNPIQNNASSKFSF